MTKGTRSQGGAAPVVTVEISTINYKIQPLSFGVRASERYRSDIARLRGAPSCQIQGPDDESFTGVSDTIGTRN